MVDQALFDDVAALGKGRGRWDAAKRLQAAGEAGVAAVMEGMRHPDPGVRAACCGFLDHCNLDDEATRLLVAALDDPFTDVRKWAAHSLACDACKPGDEPSGDSVLDRLLDVLRNDRSASVRKMAAGTLGQHRANPAVRAALEHAHAHDPHTKVRQSAAWATGRRTSFVHQLHPPGEVRLFAVPFEAWRRARRAIVADERHGDVALRHYGFTERWYAVNVTTDLDGRPVEGDEGFAYNCDVATPAWRSGSRWYEVDLELDVLVRADGRSYEVTDHDDFERACVAGWITPHERDGALRGLDELVGLVEQGGLHALLEDTCRLGDMRHAPAATPYEVLDLHLYPQLTAGIRPTARDA